MVNNLLQLNSIRLFCLTEKHGQPEAGAHHSWPLITHINNLYDNQTHVPFVSGILTVSILGTI